METEKDTQHCGRARHDSFGVRGTTVETNLSGSSIQKAVIQGKEEQGPKHGPTVGRHSRCAANVITPGAHTARGGGSCDRTLQSRSELGGTAGWQGLSQSEVAG